MTATKIQEKAALEQIKKIVESLGEDSYLSSAFTGVFELAEQNIEWDACSTMTERVDQLNQEVEDKKKEVAGLMQQAKKEMLKAEEMKKQFKTDRHYWEDIRKSLDWAAYQLSDKLGY